MALINYAVPPPMQHAMSHQEFMHVELHLRPYCETHDVNIVTVQLFGVFPLPADVRLQFTYSTAHPRLVSMTRQRTRDNLRMPGHNMIEHTYTDVAIPHDITHRRRQALVPVDSNILCMRWRRGDRLVHALLLVPMGGPAPNVHNRFPNLLVSDLPTPAATPASSEDSVTHN
jgi:hypothetical protein